MDEFEVQYHTVKTDEDYRYSLMAQEMVGTALGGASIAAFALAETVENPQLQKGLRVAGAALAITTAGIGVASARTEAKAYEMYPYLDPITFSRINS